MKSGMKLVDKSGFRKARLGSGYVLNVLVVGQRCVDGGNTLSSSH